MCGHEREARQWLCTLIAGERENEGGVDSGGELASVSQDGVAAGDAGDGESEVERKATVGSVYPGCASFPSALTQSFMPFQSGVVARQLSRTRRSTEPRGVLPEVLGPGPQACYRASNGDAGYKHLGWCDCEPIHVTTSDALVRIQASSDPREACLQVSKYYCLALGPRTIIGSLHICVCRLYFVPPTQLPRRFSTSPSGLSVLASCLNGWSCHCLTTL